MAKIKLTWADAANSDHTGYRIRMGDGFSKTPAATFVEKATVAADVREYSAGGDAVSGAKYWAVSAYNADQDVLAAKIAMSWPGLIVPVDQVFTVKDGIENTRMGPDDTKITQCIPTAGTGGDWTGPNSNDIMVQTSDSDIFFVGQNLTRIVFGTDGNPASMETLVACPYSSGQTSAVWAIAIPGTTTILAMYRNAGMALYDYAAKTAVKKFEATAYNPIKAGLLPDGVHIVMTGGNTGTSDNVKFSVLNTSDWTVVDSITTGITGAHSWYGGALLIGAENVCYWPNSNGSKPIRAAVSDLLAGTAESAAVVTTSVTLPTAGGFGGWTIGPNADSWINYSNGTVYMVELAAMMNGPVAISSSAGADYFGISVSSFTTSQVSSIVLPDGAVWMVGTSAAMGIYYTWQGDTNAAIVSGYAGGYWFTFMHKGNLFSISNMNWWRPGFSAEPVLSMPQAWWRSQHNYQGHHNNQ